MNKTRLKRLLYLAHNFGNCKRFYRQYVKLMNEYYNPSLVEWYLGHAYLTEAGVKKLEELSGDKNMGVQ